MITVRFRQTTPSDNPDFPFQAGQVITVPRLSDAVRTAIREQQADVLGGAEDEPDEMAALGSAPETAQLPRPRPKGSRA